MLAALQTCSIIITYESRYVASSSFLEGVADQELVVTTEILYFQKVQTWPSVVCSIPLLMHDWQLSQDDAVVGVQRGVLVSTALWKVGIDHIR